MVVSQHTNTSNSVQEQSSLKFSENAGFLIESGFIRTATVTELRAENDHQAVNNELDIYRIVLSTTGYSDDVCIVHDVTTRGLI